MKTIQFKPASNTSPKLRLALNGPAGSGKTYSALAVATALGEKVAMIDTEHGKSALYADEFAFDMIELESFSPESYIVALDAAQRARYEVVIVDSLSHAWAGKDGALEMADREKIRSNNNNSFVAWKNVTPLWHRLIERLLSLDAHLIGTFRAKTEYVIEPDERGRSVPRKVGLAPIFREGSEFEFDIVGDMNLDNQLIIGKTRCKALKGAVIDRPGVEFANTLNDWLEGLTGRELTSALPSAENEANPTSPVRSTTANESRPVSPTIEIERLGREIYHDMWSEKSEEIAAWASGHRTKSVTDLTDTEKGRVLVGMQDKMKKAA